MVCDKCGFENEEGAQVCISCGSRLPALPADLNSTKQIKGADDLDAHPDTALDDVESTSSIDIAEMFGDDEDSGIGNSPKSDQPNDERNEDQASDDGHGKFGERRRITTAPILQLRGFSVCMSLKRPSISPPFHLIFPHRLCTMARRMAMVQGGKLSQDMRRR